jgi:signal transduction histidine kinase
MNSVVFIAQRVVAWSVLLVLVLIVWSGMIGAPEWIWALFAFFTILRVTFGLISHVRRVRLIADAPDARSFGNRHRRIVEVPFPAEEAFTLAEAAIRELPNVDAVESARDSLQIHARVLRRHPYDLPRAAGRRRRWNLVHATVTPSDGTSRVAVVCEPERAAWRDWFFADHGTNLENAEAITRAISRRVSERRKEEEARVRQTATEKELTEAKLSLLHAQVEPHFLYNTLASAQLLTRSDPAKADRMLGNLISYLRHSLPRTEASLSSLGDEVERARAYLEIMKIRMGERLALQVQVPEALRTVPMPAMMLQTLAENAIKHGLEPLPEGGNVWISARVAGDRAAITVADDGRGFSEDGGGTGIGLKNVRERLRLAYGDAASLSIVANFPKGVAATITVPVSGPAQAAHA